MVGPDVDHVAGRHRVRGQHPVGVPPGEGHHAAAVDDRLAAVHRRRHRSSVGQVADDVRHVAEPHRRQDLLDAGRVAHQGPHPVSGVDQGPEGVRAEVAGPPGHQHLHPAPVQLVVE